MTATLTPAQRPLLLRNRDFALVWIGQVLSQGGSRIYQIGLLWWLLGEVSPDLRGIAAGAFLVLVAVPALLLVRVIGRVLDTVPSRTVMLRAEIVAGFAVAVVAGLAWIGHVPVWPVYVVGLVVATCQAFFDPCLTKATPELVAEPDVERAIGFESSTQSVANFAGAAFGALLLATVGFPGAVAINAASYAISALCLAAAKFRSSPAPKKSADAENRPEGLRQFLRALPGVWPLLACFAVANCFSAPTLLVLPLYTQVVLHGSAETLALMESGLWLGLLLGAVCAAYIKVPGRTTRFAAACIAGFGGCLCLPGLVPVEVVCLTALVLAGLCLGVANVKFVALFQRVVPDGRKGRFFAILQASICAGFPLAFLAFGALGDAVSPQTLWLIQGVGLAAVGLALVTMRDPRPS
ncbi:MFS transporter [Amycolatopsis sp. SID8362]|uniref:MFS transporter n=1 Tax=Amycolatopsis sp. SID8362 TaxID=2690346 RepID=UPI001368EF71|nr:MFS transporter [Amycolatopsis sp. SID8362]NBH03508.1 MFS transporter [Amycolatopsis sp. SID8362]NED40208.1 MFS transporter [Amycolatopsis sp. SID8362]